MVQGADPREYAYMLAHHSGRLSCPLTTSVLFGGPITVWSTALHCFLHLAEFPTSGVVNTEDGLPQPPMPPCFRLERLENEKLHFPDSLAAKVLDVNRIVSVTLIEFGRWT